MDSILPIITMSDLQRSAKEKLEGVTDYAVVRRHGKDMAFILHPALGKVLLESGLLEVLKQKLHVSVQPHGHAKGVQHVQSSMQQSIDATQTAADNTQKDQLEELDRILGKVIIELSKR